MRRALLLALTLLVAGCASSHPIDLRPKPALDARDVLEFSYRGETVTLESVRYSADSVTGIPWRQPTDPRVAYPVSEISGAKLFETGKSGDHAGTTILVALGVLLAAFIGAMASYGGGS